MREHRPDLVLEPAIIDLEILAIGILVLGRREAAEIIAPLGPEIDAGGVDDELVAIELGAAIDDEDEALARPHRQRDAGERGDVAGLRARGIDEDAARNLAALGERDTGNAAA